MSEFGLAQKPSPEITIVSNPIGESLAKLVLCQLSGQLTPSNSLVSPSAPAIGLTCWGAKRPHTLRCNHRRAQHGSFPSGGDRRARPGGRRRAWRTSLLPSSSRAGRPTAGAELSTAIMPLSSRRALGATRVRVTNLPGEEFDDPDFGAVAGRGDRRGRSCGCPNDNRQRVIHRSSPVLSRRASCSRSKVRASSSHRGSRCAATLRSFSAATSSTWSAD